MLEERTPPGLHGHLLGIVQKLGIARGPVLDIGCGSGAWLSRLRDMGMTQLVGIDTQRPGPVRDVEFKTFDINHDDNGSLGQFQLVTCIEVIEHVENIGRLLDLIKAAVAPDGCAIITTPNVESLRARSRALLSGKMPSFDNKSDPTHLMPILKESLEKMLLRRRMRIEKILMYPDQKARSVMFTRRVAVLTRLLRLVLVDDLHGDNAIYVIKHRV